MELVTRHLYHLCFLAMVLHNTLAKSMQNGEPKADTSNGQQSSIVYPQLKDKNGNNILSIFDNSLTVHYDDIRHRRRRSIADVGNSSDPEFDLDLGDLHLNIRYMNDLVSPMSMMEWMEQNVTVASRIRNGCIFSGKVKSVEGSFGVFNLCHGITGVISTPREEIYVQPDKGEDSSNYDQPHIIRRKLNNGKPHSHRHHHHHGSRQPTEHTQHRCGVSHSDVPAVNKEGGSQKSEEKSRVKRDLYGIGPKYLEVMVATDNSVVDFHGEALVEQYLLTQMYIVNSVYQHPSLEFNIEIIVTGIIIMDDSTADSVVIKGDAKKTLDRFCYWVNYNRPSQFPTQPKFDMAIYLTKGDIGPAGYAPVTGMCHPMRSCSVNIDDGISSAFVIAHELGHVFGMLHDGHMNDCEQDPSDGKIMAAMVQASYDKFYWTRCSRERLNDYIDGMYCLNNQPEEPDWPSLVKPYGQSWSLDEQCRQEFGEEFQLCRAFTRSDPCEYMWCSTKAQPLLCKTKRGPPLPGTECAPGKWCMDGTCKRKSGVPIDGGWGNWGSWGTCSRSCGRGVHYRNRKCNDPEPSQKGNDCAGRSEDFELCNTENCEGEKDSRATQCTALNQVKVVKGRKHTWLPVENKNVEKLCKLTCMSKETKDSFETEEDVEDGTFCSYEIPYDVCIKGKCQMVGCDGRLQSDMSEDRCGVCGGDGRSCRQIAGNYRGYIKKKRYHKVVRIPYLARNIVIREEPANKHFLAVKDEVARTYLVNGGGKHGHSIQFIHQGVRMVYLARDNMESLAARGPLKQDLLILVYSQSTLEPVSIAYEYDFPNQQIYELKNEQIYGFTVNHAIDTDVKYEKLGAKHKATTIAPVPTTPKEESGEEYEYTYEYEYEDEDEEQEEDKGHKEEETDLDEEELIPHRERAKKIENEVDVVREIYLWRVKAWTDCSITCGQGVQQEVYACFDEKNLKVVSPSMCEASDKPEAKTRECSAGLCLRWEVGEWGNCTKQCGNFGMQERTLYCMTDYYGDDMAVDHAYCNHSQVPEYLRPCNTGVPCISDWQTGPWSKCSVSCGFGVQTRPVTCRDAGDGNTYICNTSRPHDSRDCKIPCPAQWKAGPWSECLASCGEGVQTRKVICDHPDDNSFYRCPDEAPPHTRNCSLPACPERDNATSFKEVDQPKSPKISCTVEDPCTVEWTVENWTKCTTSCGLGIKRRVVYCNLPDDGNYYQCSPKRPHDTTICNIKACPVIKSSKENKESLPTRRCTRKTPCQANWRKSDWSECSSTCGKGSQSRKVTCGGNPNREAIYSCDKSTRPIDSQTCFRACPADWVTGEWSQCSVSCGRGTQTRSVMCGDQDKHDIYTCSSALRPLDTKPCYSLCPARWATAQWSECSVSCGSGTQTRSVFCDHPDDHNTYVCKEEDQPSDTRICNTLPCPAQVKPKRRDNGDGPTCTKDKSFFCKLATADNCGINLYKTMCCASCRQHQP